MRFLKICFVFLTFWIGCQVITAQVIGVDRSRVQYQAWQHLMQECQAELPDDCPTYVKALGQSCVADNECLAPAKCLDFKCNCPENFLSSSGRCLQAGLNQTCIDGQCAPPYVCSRRDICECPPTMDLIRNGCQPRCADGEIAFNGTCFRLEKLGGRCNSSVQCQTAFSHCGNEKCECISGTKERTGECQPTYTCPDNQKPMEDPQNRDEVLKCHSQTCASAQFPSKPSKVKVDTCPNGTYCVFPSYQELVGFCCPEKAYCPFGEPLAGKICVNPRTEQEKCPSLTHHCYVGPRGPTCCPLACPSIQGDVAVMEKGICYHFKQLGEICNVSAQCPQPSTCNGTCQCPDGYQRQFGPSGEKCVKLCAPGEVLVRSECLPLAVPSKPCVHSSQCTAGSRCFNGKCECPCGTVLYNGHCVEKPRCPNFGNGIFDPLSTPSGTVIECSPMAMVSGNTTCPDKAFCYPALVYSGGICCPFPDPVCTLGRRPPTDRLGEVHLCDLPILTGGRELCPRDQYCHDYMVTILPSLNRLMDRKGVCCWETQPYGTSSSWSTTSGAGNRFPSLDLCPSNHQPLFQFGSQLRRCNYYSYIGECGLNAGCFLHRDSSRFQPHESGLCCIWQQGRK